MGFLDNTSITVDAILTKKGRELLARGQNEFKITKFALADDEIDYNLYDTSHPNGSNFFAAVIENMPLLEAFEINNTSKGNKQTSYIGITKSIIDFQWSRYHTNCNT